MRTTTPYDEILHDLVHDLRQPLGTIETGVFCLDLMLGHPSGKVQDQLHAIERQVAQAVDLLQRATKQLQAQRITGDGAFSPEDEESFDRTNSVTAGVT